MKRHPLAAPALTRRTPDKAIQQGIEPQLLVHGADRQSQVAPLQAARSRAACLTVLLVTPSSCLYLNTVGGPSKVPPFGTCVQSPCLAHRKRRQRRQCSSSCNA